MTSIVLGLTPAAIYQQSAGGMTWFRSGEAVCRNRHSFPLVLEDRDIGELSRQLERGMRITRVNSFLESRNSPLAGLGEVFVETQERTGVSAALLVALTLAESSCATAGSLSRTNHNAWGMKGPQPSLGIPAENGYCWWSDWRAAINGAADFIVHYWGPAQTGLDLKGYARRSGPGSSWLSRVEGTRSMMI